MRRHTVIASGWDEKRGMGWYRFRCNTCGHEYKWWAVHRKLWDIKPPLAPGMKSTRQRKRFTRAEHTFFARYWGLKSGAKGDGVGVTECASCLPKRAVGGRHDRD
jgi:hypothetical protein